jgi:hypothetical protein
LIAGWFGNGAPPFLDAHLGPVAMMHVDRDP